MQGRVQRAGRDGKGRKLGDILLITGRPGVGKTTVIRRLAEAFPGRVGGFYTEEIREEGRRVGFLLVTLGGRAAPFAHRAWQHTSHRVGRYGVDLRVLEELGVAAIREALAAGRAVLVDEIGKMELASAGFREALEEAASGSAWLVATILAAHHPWADRFRRRAGTTELLLTPHNRDAVFERARRWLDARVHPTA